MQKNLIQKLRTSFEDYRHEKDGIEYWLARELQELLEYAQWRNFEEVINKAKESCENAKQSQSNHFADLSKMVKLGSGSERKVEDVMLTRYACYLIAQNGDPRKEVIAFAQSYFALQTRKQELLEERIAIQERIDARKKLTETETKFSKLIFERGVDNRGFGRIRSKGDLQGEPPITKEHVKNNKEVRKLLNQRGIKPEELPPEEDTLKLEKMIKRDDKGIRKSINKISTQ